MRHGSVRVKLLDMSDTPTAVTNQDTDAVTNQDTDTVTNQDTDTVTISDTVRTAYRVAFRAATSDQERADVIRILLELGQGQRPELDMATVLAEVTAPEPDVKDWVTVDGACAILSVSRRTVARMLADGRLVGHQPSGAGTRVTDALIRRTDLYRLTEVC